MDYDWRTRPALNLALTHFDRDLNFNDLGFQRRAGISELALDMQYFTRQYRQKRLADSGNWHLALKVSRNAADETLPGTIEVGDYWHWLNGAGSYVYYQYETAGVGDARGAGC